MTPAQPFIRASAADLCLAPFCRQRQPAPAEALLSLSARPVFFPHPFVASECSVRLRWPEHARISKILVPFGIQAIRSDEMLSPRCLKRPAVQVPSQAADFTCDENEAGSSAFAPTPSPLLVLSAPIAATDSEQRPRSPRLLKRPPIMPALVAGFLD